jgi:hypothetical protein
MALTMGLKGADLDLVARVVDTHNTEHALEHVQVAQVLNCHCKRKILRVSFQTFLPELSGSKQFISNMWQKIEKAILNSDYQVQIILYEFQNFRPKSDIGLKFDFPNDGLDPTGNNTWKITATYVSLSVLIE